MKNLYILIMTSLCLQTAQSWGQVTSIIGTVNQITSSSSTGNVTLSLPQSIGTLNTPTFNGLNLSGMLAGTSATLVKANGGDIDLQDGSGRGLYLRAPNLVTGIAFVGTPTNHNLIVQAGISPGNGNTLQLKVGSTEKIKIADELITFSKPLTGPSGSFIKSNGGDLDFQDEGGRRLYLQAPNLVTGVAFVGTPTNHDLVVQAGISPGNGNTLKLKVGSTEKIRIEDELITFNKPLTGTSATFNGNLSIGANNLQGYKLAVAGNIIAESVKVKLQAAWPDYVFEDTYKLEKLDRVEKFINKNKHLPDIPSAAEVAKEGINLGEMDAKLLKKIEELTMYIIELKKEVDQLKKNPHEN